MLNIGWTEFVFLVLIFFVFIKPKDIPVVLKKIFYVFNKFKNFISDITTEINQSIYVEEFKKKNKKIIEMDKKYKKIPKKNDTKKRQKSKNIQQIANKKH